MKLSNKILTGGFIGVIVVFITFIVMLIVNNPAKELEVDSKLFSNRYKNQALLAPDSPLFNGISLNGAWEIEVKYGQNQGVLYSGSEEYLERIRYEVKNETLYLTSPESIKPEDLGFSITIYTPELSWVDSKGAVSITIDSVNSENFNLNAHGIINLITDNCIYRNVKLYLEGIGNLELNGSNIKDLYIDSSILGSIAVDVDNAIVDGSIEGMGSVTIEGGVKSNKLQSDGIVELVVK